VSLPVATLTLANRSRRPFQSCSVVQCACDVIGALDRTPAPQPLTVDVVCLVGWCAHDAKITIATQCDLRRFGERLPRLADVWAGPMVIALLVKSMEDSVAVQQILDAPGSETLTWCVTSSFISSSG
jgi:hypothetical protein